jgi:hypothetical protein
MDDRTRAMTWQACKLGAIPAIVAATAVALIGGQVPAPAGATPIGRAPGLHSMGSCDHLRSFLRRHGSTHPPIAVGEGAAGGDIAAPSAGAEATAASPTNLQEAGVDEPDIVKTAGDTILSVDGTTLRAVGSNGGNPELLDELELAAGPDSSPVNSYQLLVSGDHLLAIGVSYGFVAIDEGMGGTAAASPVIGYPGDPSTSLTEIDISDPSHLRVVRSMTVDGSYVSARLTGSTVRMATSSYPSAPTAESGNGRAMLPRYTLTDARTGAQRQGKLVGCRRVDRPSRFAGTGLLTVSTIDLDRGLPAIDADGILTDGQIVYGSPTSLYIATERWSDSADDSGSQASTEIHRFDTSAPDSTRYVASGRVTGYMLSQWSMSEQDGLLRVASTTAPPWDDSGAPEGKSQTLVSVLATDGDRLVHVGRLDGLGRGDDVYAVRFIGDAGYVVTFRQIDPLHVIDLSDPTNPRAVGELEIPGYSAYLHPVGPGLLLGVGREVSADGVPGGVQASLFDVSDPANPVRIDRESFGRGSSTEVEYDHHAFSWFDGDSLAAIPIDSYSTDPYSNDDDRFGFVGLRVTPGAADPLGRVDRPQTHMSVRRTLELGGRLYAIGSDAVSVYDPTTLTPLAKLGL